MDLNKHTAKMSQRELRLECDDWRALDAFRENRVRLLVEDIDAALERVAAGRGIGSLVEVG